MERGSITPFLLHNGLTLDFIDSFPKFSELVEKGNKLVLEQIVTTIASVADTAQDNFVEHYDK